MGLNGFELIGLAMDGKKAGDEVQKMLDNATVKIAALPAVMQHEIVRIGSAEPEKAYVLLAIQGEIAQRLLSLYRPETDAVALERVQTALPKIAPVILEKIKAGQILALFDFSGTDDVSVGMNDAVALGKTMLKRVANGDLNLPLPAYIPEVTEITEITEVSEEPAPETPATETPAAEIPATEVPVTPEAETPVAEATPETPVPEAPAQETPAPETPAPAKKLSALELVWRLVAVAGEGISMLKQGKLDPAAIIGLVGKIMSHGGQLADRLDGANTPAEIAEQNAKNQQTPASSTPTAP